MAGRSRNTALDHVVVVMSGTWSLDNVVGYPHTSTQLFGILSEAKHFKPGAEISERCNAPEPGQKPTMDGFVTGYAATCPGGMQT